MRRMPDSLVAEFGQRLAAMDWNFLVDGLSADRMVEEFEFAAARLVEETFPQKEVVIIEGYQPYFTEELRQMRRQRNRAYQRAGKSPTYSSLQKKFNDKLKCEANKYKQKILTEVKMGQRGSGYAALRKLGENQTNMDQRKELQIPAYSEEGLGPQEAAERLARHFQPSAKRLLLLI